MKNKNIFAIFLAFLSALLYSISTPISKILLESISPTLLAGILYLGAGIGVSIIYLFNYKKEKEEKKLQKSDFVFVVLMVLLDVSAPILLMIGIKSTNASSVSLLNNFEIVATTLIAFLFFKEKVSLKLLFGIIIIIISSALLSVNLEEGFKFSTGSLFVLLASVCWGLENNCTRRISDKSTYQIVIIKGICSGLISLIIGLILKERINNWLFVIYSLILGFIAYGLSIFVYVKAQYSIGASKTSAFYTISPFLGTALSFIILKESPNLFYYIALPIMIIGTIFVILDTIKNKNDIETI